MSTSSETVTVLDPAQFGKLRLKSHDSLSTIDDLIKSHASESEDFPLVAAPVSGVIDFEEHSARDIDRYVDAAAQCLLSKGLPPADPARDEAPIAGLLCQSGLDMVITLLGLIRLGYGALLLSTRLAAPAYARLMSMTNCSILISTPTFGPTIDDIEQERPLQRLSLLQRDDYIGVKPAPFRRQYDAAKENKKIAVIIHSSGSTGFPKPIYLRHAQCLSTFTQNFGLREFLVSPLFHSQGFYELFRTIYSKKCIYLCNYAIPHTRQSLAAQLEYLKPELFACVPYILKLLCETDEGIEQLAKTRLVVYAGSGCPDDIGDLLVKRDVNLVQNYGTTEIGRIMTSFREPGDNDWNYLRLRPPVSEHVLMDEIAPGVFECVALESLSTRTSVNTDNPPNAFRSRDLFAPHPTRPNLWKYLARLDDRLTLVNGEKVLPLPIEGRIRQDRLVQEVAVFGIGKSVPGVLIVKSADAATMSSEEFLEAVWPSVEAANSNAESFSRIPKELVIVVSADTPYAKTDKGTFIRAKVYDQFKDEIEKAYNDFENGQVGTLVLEGPELEQWLLEQFNKELDVSLESKDADFYQAGIDSLQSTRMYSHIRKELDLGGNHGSLSKNVLYETGNPASLARYLYALRTGHQDAQEDELAVMEELIKKYSTFPQHQPGNVPAPTKQVVLLTGTTGTLGIHILHQLLQQPNISSVYALVRASDPTSALTRIESELSKRHLTLSASHLSKIIPITGDLSKPDLGLSPTTLHELRTQLTTVIHSAWAVNFNLGVRSFESHHIAGTYHLLLLCLSTITPKPASFYFLSSVSAGANTPSGQQIHERLIPSPSHSQATGYGRSKYVTEHIVSAAKKSTGMLARTLRLGQICGDSVHGMWNSTEAVALMVQSAVTLGMLPKLEERVAWLPVDYTATIVLELSGIVPPSSSSPSDTKKNGEDVEVVFAVQNPKTHHWTHSILPALRAAGLKFDAVSPQEWLDRLAKSDPDPTRNPPVKLVGFFGERYGNAGTAEDVAGGWEGGREGGEGGDGNGVEVKSAGRFETKVTCQASKTMRNIPDLVESGMVGRFVRRWAEEWGVVLGGQA